MDTDTEKTIAIKFDKKKASILFQYFKKNYYLDLLDKGTNSEKLHQLLYIVNTFDKTLANEMFAKYCSKNLSVTDSASLFSLVWLYMDFYQQLPELVTTLALKAFYSYQTEDVAIFMYLDIIGSKIPRLFETIGPPIVEYYYQKGFYHRIFNSQLAEILFLCSRTILSNLIQPNISPSESINTLLFAPLHKDSVNSSFNSNLIEVKNLEVVIKALFLSYENIHEIMDKETAIKVKKSLLKLLTTYPLLLKDNSTFISVLSYFKDHYYDLYTEIMQTIAVEKLRTLILRSKS